MIVAVGLASLMLMIMAMIFHQCSKVFSMSDAQMEVHQNARVLLDILTRDLNGATLTADFEMFHGYNDHASATYDTGLNQFTSKNGADVLMFLTNVPNASGTNQAIIVYVLGNDDVLRRAVNTTGPYLQKPGSYNPPAPGDLAPAQADAYSDVAYNVQGFQIQYCNSVASSPTWSNSWDCGSAAAKYLPSSVKVTVRITDYQSRVTLGVAHVIPVSQGAQ